jgi:hypothetical protein
MPRYRLIKCCRQICATAALAAAIGCSMGKSSQQTTQSFSQNTTFGVTTNPRPVPPPGPQDSVDAANMVSAAGARGAVVAFRWSELEPSPGVYTLQNLQSALSFYSGRNFTIYLGIQVINTVPRETPPDLLTVSWDNPQMKSRFHALWDAIRPSLTPQVHYVSIGNEVDVYLAAHPAEWTTYKNFFEDGLAYVHQTAPNLQVGVTTTFSGAAGASSTNVSTLNAKSDVWIFTYYPLGPGFVPRAPQAPLTDFPTMRMLAGSHPVVLQEAGYPSASLISSSESNQAAFVSNVFQAWQAGAQQMPYINYFLLHDFTSNVCSSLAQYYGDPNDPAFEAYLCSLGLRHTDGTPKAGWQSLVSTAAADGFPH